MIGVEVQGGTVIAERLVGIPAKAKQAALAALTSWSAELASYIKTTKLSGDPLHRRSGNLSRSILPDSGEITGGVYGGAKGGAGVPYAQIHEFGGLIPAHEIVARNAKVLAFTVDGVRRYARSVQIPAVQMPERSYMRSSFQERAPDGVAKLREAIMASIGTSA